MSEEKKIDENKIEVFEAMVIKSGDISISIYGDPEGQLYGKTTEQMLLTCADVLQQASGGSPLEEAIEVPEALKQTLSITYGWTDLEINQFIKTWRKNLYLMRIGKDTGIPVDLEEYNRFVTYLDKKKAKDLGELEVGGDGTLEDEFVASIEEREMTKEPEAKPNTTNTASVFDGKIDGVENLLDVALKPRQLKKK